MARSSLELGAGGDTSVSPGVGADPLAFGRASEPVQVVDPVALVGVGGAVVEAPWMSLTRVEPSAWGVRSTSTAGPTIPAAPSPLGHLGQKTSPRTRRPVRDRVAHPALSRAPDPRVDQHAHERSCHRLGHRPVKPRRRQHIHSTAPGVFSAYTTCSTPCR